MMKKRDVLFKITFVLLAVVVGWRVMLVLNERFVNDAYSSGSHLLSGIGIALFSLLLISQVRKLDGLSWKALGMQGIRRNVSHFLVGVLLWLVPALIGLGISFMAGWVEVSVTSSLSQLLGGGMLLFITVFLIEAFPEELIMRSYIYQQLNSIWPHWLTVVGQTLIFTLFAYLIGAIYSVEQLLFLPGYGFMLGYIRAKSGNVWTTIGFHTALMTATQLISSLHGHFVINDSFVIIFFAFNLMPYILGAIALDYLFPKLDWQEIKGSVQ